MFLDLFKFLFWFCWRKNQTDPCEKMIFSQVSVYVASWEQWIRWCAIYLVRNAISFFITYFLSHDTMALVLWAPQQFSLRCLCIHLEKKTVCQVGRFDCPLSLAALLACSYLINKRIKANDLPAHFQAEARYNILNRYLSTPFLQ